MEVNPREIEIYTTADGRQPFAEWIDSLRDSIAQDRIKIRIARVRRGNLGNYRSVGLGVSELKIDYGPGYRIYFGQLGSTIVVLLCGGDKSSQEKDILTAQAYWSDYRSNAHG